MRHIKLVCVLIGCVITAMVAPAVSSNERIFSPEKTVLPLMANTPYETPAYIFQTGREGPAVMILGGVHGDEPAGSHAAGQLLGIRIQKGTLIIIPKVNKTALLAGVRTLPEVGDVNRAYPGKRDGLPSERLAYEIMELVRQYGVSMFIDLHEAKNFHKVNPNSLGQSIEFADNDKSALLTLGAIEHINRQIDDPVKQFSFLGHPIPDSGAYYAGKQFGIAAFTVETSVTQPLAERIRQHYEIAVFLLRAAGLDA